MPRDGSGVLSAPAGTTATAGTTIESAKYNAFVADWVADGNTARPIVAGGTGATTAGAALTALGGQPLDADLTSWAAITRASGFDTFVATPTSASLQALLTDEVGTGAAYFVGGALGTPASGTLTNCTGLTTSGIAAATLVTASETVASNNNDTTIPTSAAVVTHGIAIGRTLLSTQTASASATLDFTAFNAALYRYYEFELEDVKPATDAVDLILRFSTNAGSSYDAGASDYGWSTMGQSNGTITGGGNNASSAIFITTPGIIGNAAGEKGVTGHIKLYHAGTATTYTRAEGTVTFDNTTSIHTVITFAGRRTADQDTDAVRFLFTSGNIASGVIRMYGVN